MNKLFIVFGIILVIFAGFVFFQFRSKPNNNAASQAALSTVKIKDQTFKVEVVDTPELTQLGLSGRDSLPQDQGMLFLFEKEDYHTFWMKNMKFPIDIIFINGNDEIVSVAKNAQPPKSEQDNLPLYKSGGPIDAVLEINAGLSDKYGIKEGDTVEINIVE